jgi:tetratricopeptide (TPR) repeat protein
MKAIIHIGTLKTGSTSIQNSLFSNRELLLKKGVIYPDIGSHFQHWGLFTAFMDEHPSNFHIFRDWGWGRESSEQWSLEKVEQIRQYARSNNQYMIISAEDLHRINSKLENFKHFLDDIFEQYFILLYGRLADSYYSSWISEFIGQGVNNFTFPLDYKHNLINVVNLWKSVFSDNFIARPFSSESLVNGDVVDDFLEVVDRVLGVKLKSNFVKVYENASPSGTAIALLHLFNQKNNRFVENKLNTFWFNARQLLRTCPASQESPKLSFSKEVREIIRINNLPEWKQFIEICRETCSKHGLIVSEDSIDCKKEITHIMSNIQEFDVDKWIESYLTPEGLNYVITYIVNQYTGLSQINLLLTETQHKSSSYSSKLEEKESLIKQISHQLEQKTKELEVYRSLEKSITKYHRQIETAPNSFLLHQKLGETLANEKDLLDQAITEFKKAIELKPDSALSYGYLGETLVQQGLLEEAINYLKKAINYLKKAIEIQPKFYRFYNSLGVAFLKQENWDEAISNFEKAIGLKPNLAWGYYNLGLIFSCQEKLETASNYFGRAVHLNPSLLNRNLLAKYRNYISKIGLAQWDVIQPLKFAMTAELIPVTESCIEELCTFNIDILEVTDGTETVQILLGGWIFGNESKVISVKITHNNSLLKEVPIDVSRPDVFQMYQKYNLEKNTGFNILFAILQKLIKDNNTITVQAVFDDGGSVPFQVILVGKRLVVKDRPNPQTEK